MGYYRCNLVIEQHTREDALKHMRYAEELERDRILIGEAIRSRRKRTRPVANSMQVDGFDMTQEPQLSYDWKRIVASMLLNRDKTQEIRWTS
jgi:hypothetical protein